MLPHFSHLVIIEPEPVLVTVLGKCVVVSILDLTFMTNDSVEIIDGSFSLHTLGVLTEVKSSDRVGYIFIVLLEAVSIAVLTLGSPKRHTLINVRRFLRIGLTLAHIAHHIEPFELDDQH